MKMNTNIIEYIIKNKKIKQNEIAKKLGVTTGQISKWKQGEYISSERRLELNKLADLFSDNPDWIDISKTKRNAESWFKYINQLSDNANIEIQ
jgi:transcriptional regulator with XRE-family HTH domain